MIEIVILISFLCILIIVELVLVFILTSSFYSDFKGAPFIPNDHDVIKEALKFAGVNEEDILIDLGSGNGKVLRIAIKDFKVKEAIGYEIAPWPYIRSLLTFCVSKRQASLTEGSKKKIKIYRRSLFEADLSRFTVVYVYLLPKILQKLKPMIISAKRKNPNLAIVSVVFEIKGLKPIKKTQCYHKGFKRHIKIFLY